MQIYDFVKSELDMFRRECNFTEEELQFFNLRSSGLTIEVIAEQMNISVGKANILSKKVKKKMIRVV